MTIEELITFFFFFLVLLDGGILASLMISFNDVFVLFSSPS
jgi:hypothetical protein